MPETCYLDKQIYAEFDNVEHKIKLKEHDIYLMLSKQNQLLFKYQQSLFYRERDLCAYIYICIFACMHVSTYIYSSAQRYFWACSV